MRTFSKIKEITHAIDIGNNLCQYQLNGAKCVKVVAPNIYNIGDKVVYIEPKAVLPLNSDYFIDFYDKRHGCQEEKEKYNGYVVREAKIQNYESNGIIISIPEGYENNKVGYILDNFFGIRNLNTLQNNAAFSRNSIHKKERKEKELKLLKLFEIETGLDPRALHPRQYKYILTKLQKGEDLSKLYKILKLIDKIPFEKENKNIFSKIFDWLKIKKGN